MSRSVAARRGGFTLLELIIVLAVLAALAALVVPILGWVRDQSKFATAAAGAAEALNNIEMFKAATGNYPNRFDSLQASGGSVYSKLYGGETGSFVYGTSSTSASYFLKNGGGITHVMPHDESAADPNASTDTTTPLEISPDGTGSTPASLFIIDPNSANATYAAKMRRIVRAAYPNQTGGSSTQVAVPTGHYLVALGIGSRTVTSGTTMVTAPVHQGAATGKYGRYIAIFDVSAGPTFRGKVQLKMVVDSEFEVLAKNVANYQGSGPSDDQGVYTPPSGSGS